MNANYPFSLEKVGIAVKACLFTGVMIAGVAATRAAVQVTRFDPPLTLGAYQDVPIGIDWITTSVDFNVDGAPDFRLLYGWGEIGAYFNAPTRFGIRVKSPDLHPIGGYIGAVPLNSVIGSNIVSSVSTNFFLWAPGDTNYDDLTGAFGDHDAGVITANITPLVLPQPVITFSNGFLVTNINYPTLVVSGDVANKEGVMALQFYIGAERHYGYIHFNFRNSPGMNGVIYGWAYETNPDTPILAAPLSPPAPAGKERKNPRNQFRRHNQ